MNNAPVLSLKTRLTTGLVALAASFAVLHSVDTMSVHYDRAVAMNVAANVAAGKSTQA